MDILNRIFNDVVIPQKNVSYSLSTYFFKHFLENIWAKRTYVEGKLIKEYNLNNTYYHVYEQETINLLTINGFEVKSNNGANYTNIDWRKTLGQFTERFLKDACRGWSLYNIHLDVNFKYGKTNILSYPKSILHLDKKTKIEFLPDIPLNDVPSIDSPVVYFIGEKNPLYLKIGKSISSKNRKQHLGAGNPDKLYLYAVIRYSSEEKACQMEKEIQFLFDKNRIRSDSEWFKVDWKMIKYIEDNNKKAKSYLHTCPELSSNFKYLKNFFLHSTISNK